MVYVMPAQLAIAFADMVGEIAFYVARKHSDIAIDNLRSVFGIEKTDEDIKQIARQVFKNLARNAVELVRFPKISADNIDGLVSIEGRDIIDRELAKGNGAIIVTGHFGNWEIMSITLRIKGYPGAVVGRRIYFDKYDRYLNSLREHHDVNIIYRDESPKKILRVLKDNKIMGILADQDVDSVDGVFVNFFDRPAYTPTAPVALAMATGAEIIPSFMIRRGLRHTFIMEKPVELVDTGDKTYDMVRNTQAWSDIFESYIKRYPEQWVWVHRRWKTQKAG